MERFLKQPVVTADSDVVLEYRADLLSSIEELRKEHLQDQTHIRIDREIVTMPQLKKFNVPGQAGGPLVFLNMCESAQILAAKLNSTGLDALCTVYYERNPQNEPAPKSAS